MNSYSDVWATILKKLGESLTETSISTWFSDCRIQELKDSRLVLLAPSGFKKEVIAGRYTGIIKSALSDLFSGTFDVLVLCAEDLGEFLRDGGERRIDPMYNIEEFTFERFVVGNSNKFANAAAMAVAEAPADAYNPLFIYGESGLGKTHLLYAIAHQIKESFPAFKIVYIKGDEFTNELIKAIQTGKNSEFREKYREADLFLVDDIQFIAGKEQTQEEFFHTFNALYEARKQIVLTSDRPPKEMTRLEDRLKTRFEWGLSADIQAPDYETRVAIIKNKAAQLGLDFNDAVVGHIAQNITANVRQIEGTVKKILAYRDLMHEPITIETVARAIKDMYKDKAAALPTPDKIIGEVASFYQLEPRELRSQSRTKNIVLARQIAMYLIRKLTNLSLESIGQEFQGRDHSTVLNSTKKIEENIKSSSDFSETIKDIMQNINAKN